MTSNVWLFQAYPQVVDIIAKTKDARTIDLSKLRYRGKQVSRTNTPGSVRGPRRYAKDTLKAFDLNKTAYLNKVRRYGPENKLKGNKQGDT